MGSRDSASVSYHTSDRPKEVIVAGQRLDGRGIEELRSTFLSAGTLSQAAGSAYAEIGSTKVMVGVYGPRESDRKEAYSDKGRLTCDVKYTTFATRQRSRTSGQTDDTREAAAHLQTALEAAVQLDAFPKANVDVFCLVMESGGSDLAVLITAASLALADGGIPLRDLVSACRVSRVQSQLLLDSTLHEAYREDGSSLLAMMPSMNKVTQLLLTGEWTGSQVAEVLELGMGGCLQLDASMRQTLQNAAQPVQ